MSTAVQTAYAALHRSLGLVPQENGAVPGVQPGTSAGNDEAAGVQPAASVEQIRTYRKVRGESLMRTTVQPNALPAASAAVNGIQVPVADSDAGTTLTPEQVCDLPMAELLAQVDVQLGTTEINEPGFFGYSTVHASGRATVYIPSQAGDLERDIATRFLITRSLGLPTHLFPDVLQATVYDRDGEVQA